MRSLPFVALSLALLMIFVATCAAQDSKIVTADTPYTMQQDSPLSSYFIAMFKPKPSMCDLKKHPGAYKWFMTEPIKYDTTRLEVSEVGITPRLLVFRDKMHRHKNVIDISKWSEAELLEALNNPQATKEDPALVDMDLSDMSIEEITRALRFYEIYPREYIPPKEEL